MLKALQLLLKCFQKCEFICFWRYEYSGCTDLIDPIYSLQDASSHSEPSADATQAEKDAAFARQLQAQLDAEGPAGAGGDEGGFDARMSVADFMRQFGAAEQEEMLRSIRDRAVPLVAEQMAHVALPAQSDAVELAGAQLQWELDSARLADVKMPPASIQCHIEGEAIKLQLADVSARLEPFAWRAQKQAQAGGASTHDAGEARGLLSHVDITLLMELTGESLGDAAVLVRHCAVRIGAIDVQLGGSAHTQHHLTAAVSASLKSSLQDALEEHLRRAVPQHAAELFTDDDDSASTASAGSAASC